MKASKLIAGSEAVQSMTIEELMLVNALTEIEHKEDVIGILVEKIKRQNQLLDALKELAEFSESKYGDFINVRFINRTHPLFKEFLDEFKLTDPKADEEVEEMP